MPNNYRKFIKLDLFHEYGPRSNRSVYRVEIASQENARLRPLAAEG